MDFYHGYYNLNLPVVSRYCSKWQVKSFLGTGHKVDIYGVQCTETDIFIFSSEQFHNTQVPLRISETLYIQCAPNFRESNHLHVSRSLLPWAEIRPQQQPIKFDKFKPEKCLHYLEDKQVGKEIHPSNGSIIKRPMCKVSVQRPEPWTLGENLKFLIHVSD